MESKISATRAARRFSDLVNRVRYRGDTFVIERGGEAVCRISPAGPTRCTGADLVGFFSSLPRPDAGYLDDLAAVARQQEALPVSPWER